MVINIQRKDRYYEIQSIRSCQVPFEQKLAELNRIAFFTLVMDLASNHIYHYFGTCFSNFKTEAAKIMLFPI